MRAFLRRWLRERTTQAGFALLLVLGLIAWMLRGHLSPALQWLAGLATLLATPNRLLKAVWPWICAMVEALAETPPEPKLLPPPAVMPAIPPKDPIMTVDFTVYASTLKQAIEDASVAALEKFVDEEFGPNVSPDAKKLATDVVALAKQPSVSAGLVVVPDLLKVIADLDAKTAPAAAA